MCVAPPLLVCLRRFAYSVLFSAVIAQAQSINISNFYYRDYLDFGQNKGAFSGNGSTTITGKDGTKFTIPQTPNFSASSNYGSITSVGRGFIVTANHVSNFTADSATRTFGLTNYTLAKEELDYTTSNLPDSISKPYGRDEKFARFNKYVVEGQVDMLNIANSTTINDPSKEPDNLAKFKESLNDFKGNDGNIYLYQAGSGIMDLRWTSNPTGEINLPNDGSMKGGGFGKMSENAVYEILVPGYQAGDSRGILYSYSPIADFNNRITTGDSGSGIYAYDKTHQKWVLLGVTSRATKGQNSAEISFVSNKDFLNYQSKFEHKIDLSGSAKWTMNEQGFDSVDNSVARNDMTRSIFKGFKTNNDTIFSGNSNIEIEVKANIDRTGGSGLAGGFVFTAGTDSTSPTKYTFKNANGGNYSFKGSGLDIGENVVVEWALGTQKGDSLHKIGKGELKITDSTGNNGTLKIGEGKVTLNTDKKAFDNIYITSGRGELALVNGKAQALGASKSTTNGATSYTLTQESTDKMGFYFGKGGGKFDLAGNSLVLNTIAANDSGATITSATKATLEIQGYGYKENGEKDSTKKDTIIHASIGDSNSTNSANQANIDIIHNSDTKNDSAHLIFDGNINTSGKLSASSANIALQGHATAHATISDETIRNQITNAENGTQKPMPDYMDLSKPSTLNQPDWDNRTFKFGNGIDLKSSNLTLGRNASLESNITLDNSSKIEFGGNVKHFIDNKDGKNVTGSGFSYQQEVESGTLSTDMQKIANETIHYKGTITATGGTIESHILDFNASLDLKGGAKLTADYLTIEKSNTIKLENGATASAKTLKLQSISDSDLSTIFANNSANSTKLSATEALWFNSVSSFDLTKLDSANVEIKPNYDIIAEKSTITGNTKDLSANVSLFEGANLTLKSLTLKNNSADSSDSSALKNSVYLQGESTTDNNSQTNTTTTKLKLNGNLKAENLNEAKVILWGKSEISAPKIEFSGVQKGILALDKDSKLTGTTGTNGKANVEVSGTNSTLQIGMLGDKSFDINAQGGSTIILSSLPLQDSEVKNPSSNNVDSSPTAQNNESKPSANFSGKITAQDSSVVTTALESITASVALSGSASLVAKNIALKNGFDSIKLSDTATLTAQTITAKSVANLTLQQNGGTANIGKFIFDGGTTNLNGNLIGENIELKNASIVKTSDLTFNNKRNTTLTLDSTSKLELTNLNVNGANLTLNLTDSKANTANLTNIDLKNNANLTIDSWDFGNTTAFSSTGDSRVTFENATYTQNGKAQTINADSTISGELKLSNVGKAQTTQNTDSTNPSKLTFATLEFSKNLAFSENAKIEVKFSDSVKKENITLREYYTLLSADSIFDNRVNERMKFEFCQGCETLFVVSKFDGKNLQIKFLQSAPNTFNELNEALADYKNSARYSEILEALTQANPNDEAIDIATRTDDYSVLDKRIKRIDSDLNEIAQGNKTRQTRNLLFSNDQTINTRISQVRLAHSGRNKHLRFAQNDAMYRIQTLMQSAVRSDAMPSYGSKRESDLPNSVWLNVGGGYFGGDSKMGFGATNIGYDRLFDADNGSVLVGAMLGFGGSKAQTGEFIDSAMFYNIGLYLHSLFCAWGGEFGGHEIQSNISFSINDNRKTYNAKSAKNTAFGTLFALYYKYNFILAQNDTISHALKPVAVLALGYNRNGAFEINEYKQVTYNSVNFSYGFGVEYNAVMSESFYSLALTLKDMAYSGGERVFMSLSGAQNFIGYTLESAPRFSAEINLIGSHKLTDALYLQYGIAGMVDSGANYGAKGDIKLGYKF